MYGPIFYTAGCTDALLRAKTVLLQQGCQFASQPDLTVTHLLLGVPSFEADGSLKGGGFLEDILPALSPQVKLYGGMPGDRIPVGYRFIDLLEDPFYVAENARITAHCAVKLAMEKLPCILHSCPVLIVGWGRIGKCLAKLLKELGAYVTVAARKDSDRAMLDALGYDTLDTRQLSGSLLRFRAIFNTAPEMVLPGETIETARKDCLKIDLASRPGIDAPDVIFARRLPSRYAPESSGALIAKTLLRLR
jgi:dipicolinate synthase subunit A